MTKILNFLDGKKTYLIALVAAATAFADAMGWPIPDFVWPILGALGLASARAGIAKIGS